MAGAYLHQPEAAELRWLGETFTYFLATGEQTAGAFALVDEQAKRGENVPLHLHRDVPSQPGGLPPSESIDGPQIKKASREYGIEFVGPLPDDG